MRSVSFVAGKLLALGMSAAFTGQTTLFVNQSGVTTIGAFFFGRFDPMEGFHQVFDRGNF